MFCVAHSSHPFVHDWIAAQPLNLYNLLNKRGVCLMFIIHIYQHTHTHEHTKQDSVYFEYSDWFSNKTSIHSSNTNWLLQPECICSFNRQSFESLSYRPNIVLILLCIFRLYVSLLVCVWLYALVWVKETNRIHWQRVMQHASVCMYELFIHTYNWQATHICMCKYVGYRYMKGWR